MTDPYAEFASSAPSPEALDNLSKAASQLEVIETRLEQLEQELSKAKEMARNLTHTVIPSLMDDVGMSSFELTNGRKITIQEAVTCSVPVANRTAAWNWLEEQGHGGLVKRNVTVAFSCDQEEEAAALASELNDQFSSVKMDKKVEPSTLKAFVRRELKEGTNFPMQMFGAQQFRFAKIK